MKNTEKLAIREVPDGAAVAVKVVPGSSRDKITGVLGDSLKIATSAPPERGRANTAVGALLAQALGMDRRNVALISGATNPRKEFRVAGLTAEALRQRLAELP